MDSTITLVLQGLMILHEDSSQNRFEIGVFKADGHFLRITKRKNGDPQGGLDLDGYKNVPNSDLFIRVENPVLQGLHYHPQKGGLINRFTTHDKKDFRYTLDLEGAEFYAQEVQINPNLIDTTKLNPVFYLEHGNFYTLTRSVQLERGVIASNGMRKHSPQPGHTKHPTTVTASNVEPFGFVAAEVGCDITFTGQPPTLQDEHGNILYTFEPEVGVAYYLWNVLPDDPRTGLPEIHPHVDHFPMFYQLFTQPVVQYTFLHAAGPPVPDPQLCGTPQMGTKPHSLRQTEPV